MNEFIRHDPPVYPGGDINADYQTTDSWTTSWVAELDPDDIDIPGMMVHLTTLSAERIAETDRLFVFVGRTYYGMNIHDNSSIEPGEFTECEIEYILCSDPAQPGDTEFSSWCIFQRVNDDAPTLEELHTLAHTAPEPSWWEWNEAVEQEGLNALLVTI
jgi:hypothetical protein